VVTDRAISIRRDIQTLFEAGSFAGLTDGQLLERFHGSRGEVSERAFAALVERHGAMVLRVCQRILRNDHDAHDAFQATFLVLLRKSRALWVRESLGPWLHRVACRAAVRARTTQVRRQAALQNLAAVAAGPAAADSTAELLAVIHEELDRLPEHYRAAIVLCDLEGRTCEQTAQQLGCPIGTVGSRLARGREKLRGRLIRRGLAPAAGTVAATLSLDTALGSIPTPLVAMTARAAMQLSAHATAGTVTIASARIARDISRSMLMTKFLSIAAVTLAAGSLCLVTVLSYRAAAGPQPPGPQTGQKAEVKLKKSPVEATGAGLRGDDFGNDPARYKDYLIATIGNSLWDRNQRSGVAPVNRMAVLYRDGTAKLWSFDSRDPVCPPLRDATPIRDVAFRPPGILVTVAEASVKIWNSITGELLKEIPGQILRPLAFLADYSALSAHGRFVTVNTEGSVVTTWDEKSLEAVDRFRPVEPGSKRLIGAALSPDGGTLLTIADDRSISLWDAAKKQLFATLLPPSQLSASVFDDAACPLLKRPVLQIDRHFWEIVEPLKPKAKASAKK